MIISQLQAGQSVKCGDTVAVFLRMSGPDALVLLPDGRRVAWSAATSIEVVDKPELPEVDLLPILEARLATLLRFSEGKYAKLGVAVDTPCIELPKVLHPPFVQAILGAQPEDAIVCRRCTSRLCVRADHLFWGTRSDCQRDMLLRGLSRPRGKQATMLEVATRILRLQQRISRLTNK